MVFAFDIGDFLKAKEKEDPAYYKAWKTVVGKYITDVTALEKAGKTDAEIRAIIKENSRKMNEEIAEKMEKEKE